MTRRSWLLVGALVAVQAALVWGVFVAAPHPGGDNAGYVALGHALASGQGYTELWDPARPPHTKYPPVFPLLLALAMALGADGWGGLKVVSFLATLVVSPAVFLWARSRLPEGLSFGVALLVALSPSLLYHSHWVLSDVPFLAFTVLALWALSTALGESPRGTSIEAVERRGDEGGTGVVPAGPPRREGGGPWLWAGAVACLLLACFTRTAGLPLAVAGVGVLLFRRRWLAAGGVATALGVPLLLWWARGRAQAAGQGRYASEFFLLDPYQPDLGPAGAGDFVARVLDNLGAYGTRFVPEALLGSQGAGAALVGLVVVALAVSGWVRCLRRGPGVAELFLPLYAGLILVWPPVWSGDRFALPLVPILLVLAAGEAWRLTRRTGEGVRVGVLMALALTVALPAGGDWMAAREEAGRCRAASRVAGPWACGGPGLAEFVDAARWAGSHLPEGSAALTRKPRIWYVNSAVPTRTYPFSDAPGALERAAREAGARQVVLDYVGGQGVRFVGAALAARPDAFCELVAVGGDGGVPPTRILQLMPAGTHSGTRISPDGVRLAPCPESRGGGSDAPDPADWRIPLLTRSPP